MLSGKVLDLERIKEVGLSVSVVIDGLSFNILLSFLDELRVFLFFYNMLLLELVKIVFLGVIRYGVKVLVLNNGEIEVNKRVDLSVFGFNEKFIKE